MKKLLFDIAITGHHSEYIGHLVDYLSVNEDDNEYIFVVHPDFSNKFQSIVSKAIRSINITWIEINLIELEKVQKGGMIIKSFSEYKLMNVYAKRFKVNEVYHLHFNKLQLACVFFRPSYSISGILFSQFYRMEKNTFLKRLTYYRKYIITKFYVLNPKVKSVFVLNDVKTCQILNKEFKTAIFKMLPDPIPELKPLSGFNIYKHYNIEVHRKIFLHIGTLGERKGTLEVLDSALYFSNEMEQEVAILLAGRAVNKETEQLILEKIETCTENGRVSITWDNKFISNEQMKSIFNQCYGVLLPYKNTEASSGILGHAAASNKVVIATGKGLLKELVTDNQLGLLIDYVSPENIANALMISLSFKVNVDKAREFLSHHKSSFFVEKILKN